MTQKKFTRYLREEKEKSKKEIIDRIKTFFAKNPNPSDSDIHALADELNIDPHEFEEYIYSILSNYIKNESNITEQLKMVNEIFIEEAKDDLEILRLSMIAELDAVNLYERMAKIAKDERVAEVLLDVAYEEKVHAGEFETLMEELDKDYEPAEEEGEEEVEDMTGD